MNTDAHNHLHELDPASLEGTGIGLACTCGTGPGDWEAVLQLAAADRRVTPAIGIHPWQIRAGWETSLETFDRLLAADPVAVVGEIGLDRTRRSPPVSEQAPVLRRQLELAVLHGRPAVLHCVRYWGKLADLLESVDLPRRGILLHSYAGPAGLVDRFAVLGARFSFSTPPPAPVLEAVPSDRLLTESDATATNGRTPAHATRVAESIAFRLGEPPAALAERLRANYESLFSSPPPPVPFSS